MTEMEMNNTNYQRSKERLLKQAQNRYHHEGVKKRAKEYYKNDKERVQEQARNKYRELSGERKM